MSDIIDQLSVFSLSQSKLLEIARKRYSEVFSLLQNECHSVLNENTQMKVSIQEIQLKAAERDKESIKRVDEMKALCSNTEETIAKRFENEIEEYRMTMKRILSDKSEMQKKIRMLQNAFLEFQDDAVYLSLEELKTQLEDEKQKNNKIEKKMKENEEIY